MPPIVLELCAETPQACLAAQPGGADRIELCCGLSEDGLTPSHALIGFAVARSGLPVHVLLRPRGSDFVYSADEYELMRSDLVHARELGVAGFVLGVLQPDGRVDRERTAAFVELARPLPVTFHRAFDRVPAQESALEDVITTGCTRVLTSGGAPDVFMGADSLGRLLTQAAGRITVAAGGGLRLAGAAELARATGLTHFHGSMRRLHATVAGTPATPGQYDVLAEDIAALREALDEGAHARDAIQQRMK